MIRTDLCGACLPWSSTGFSLDMITMFDTNCIGPLFKSTFSNMPHSICSLSSLETKSRRRNTTGRFGYLEVFRSSLRHASFKHPSFPENNFGNWEWICTSVSSNIGPLVLPIELICSSFSSAAVSYHK